MCVICCKPAGFDLPKEDTMYNMWANNPDGAGFMYADGGVVHIRKGYMKYENFISALDAVDKKVGLKDKSVVLHFRITTHGGTKAENCHPFPVTDSLGILQKRKVDTALGVAHNGIISITPRKGISDTMEYILSQLSLLQKAVPKFYKDKNLMEMVSNAIESKMAFLDGKGSIYTIGNFTEEGGIKYSNTSFKAWRWSKSSCFDYYDELEGWQSSKEAKGQTSYYSCTYRQKAVMWLDDAKGEYVKDDKGRICFDDMYAIDVQNKVYGYSAHYAAMVPLKGYVAYTSNGVPLTYRFNDQNVTFESIYEWGR